ncbi:MAG: hypothetical protein ABWJ90_06125 [Thermus sp.]|uniref:hypothetical protein n=1 Tax=Thermus sp. TaxID=275 RepID=UPI00351AC9B4
MVKSAQKALKTREVPQEVACQIWGGRPVLRMDFSQVQVILDARTGAYLGQGSRGR